MTISSGMSQSHRDEKLIEIVQYSQHVYLQICCRISLNITINMVVALQPKFHSKQVIDKFVDGANIIRQQNKH